MKTAAIIAEYSPFHKGHRWQIEELRAQGVTHIAVVMSPDFTQRGTPAIFPKRVRAAAALQNGADLIVELPVCYAAASAQRFAFGGVQTVCAMGCVDVLAFGAEDAELPLLQQAADALEDPQVQQQLRAQLANGITFAKARELAIREVLGQQVSDVLQKPNNILAVEYLAQLPREGGPKPLPLVRIGNAHDGAPKQGFASASHIRSLILGGQWEEAKEYLPSSTWELYQQAMQSGQTASMQTGERAVLSVLRRMNREQMAALPDVSEGIENRLYQAARTACSLEELYEQIKTKRYPLSRVRRLVLSAFLGIPQDAAWQAPAYLRVLGMNERGKEILSNMKRTATLPVSTSLAKLGKVSPQAAQMAALEADCADQYRIFTKQIFPCGSDYAEFCRG